MSYSICGLIIPQAEETICSEHKWPVVALQCGVSLIPLGHDFLFLTDGDDTDPAEDFEFEPPLWLSQMVAHFSEAAYLEAAYWGGAGVQASLVWENKNCVYGPGISSDAINAALRRMGVIEGEPTTLSNGFTALPSQDPFDMVGLGKHRSVDGWLTKT